MLLLGEGVAPTEIARQIGESGTALPALAETLKVVRDNLREEAALPDDYLYQGVPGFDFISPDQVQGDRERARRLLPRLDALIQAIPGFALLMHVPWTDRQ